MTSVTLNSANPLDQPKITINLFSDKLDIIALREGVRFIDDIIMNGEGTRNIVEGDYPWPMPRTSGEAMNKMILERSQTGFHPCGTARLSKNVEQGVVDSKLRVHGVKGLRVIDASVIPVIPDIPQTGMDLHGSTPNTKGARHHASHSTLGRSGRSAASEHLDMHTPRVGLLDVLLGGETGEAAEACLWTPT